jgi:hypothetical protein
LPGEPQLTQLFVLSQARPGAVQKAPLPPAPAQHFLPAPPQLAQLPLLQLPTPAPQVEPDGTQTPPAQQAPAELQPLLWQQGIPSPPQLTCAPARQTIPLALAPEGTQLCDSSQAPAPQASPAQTGWKGPPQMPSVRSGDAPPSMGRTSPSSPERSDAAPSASERSSGISADRSTS